MFHFQQESSNSVGLKLSHLKPLPEKLASFNQDLKMEAGTEVFKSAHSSYSLIRFCSSRLGISYPLFITNGDQAYQIETRGRLDDQTNDFNLKIASTEFNVYGTNDSISIQNDNGGNIHFRRSHNSDSYFDYIDSLDFHPLPMKVRAVAYHENFGYACFGIERVGAYPIRENAELADASFMNSAHLNSLANAVGNVNIRVFVGYPKNWAEILVRQGCHQSGCGQNNYRIPCEIGEFFFPSANSIGSATLTPWGAKSYKVLDFEIDVLTASDKIENLGQKDQMARNALLDLGLITECPALQVIHKLLYP
jgi:hypothetical protein